MKTELFQIILSIFYICYMEIAQSIQQYASYPIPHHVMTWLLREYRQPNDKIHNLIKEGFLEQVKRGEGRPMREFIEKLAEKHGVSLK